MARYETHLDVRWRGEHLLVLVTLSAALLAALGAAAFRPHQDLSAGLPLAPEQAGAAREVIDVNTADAASLDRLPDIGPVLAEAIVAYRAQHGPFEELDDLCDVKGLGKATLAKIRPYLRAGNYVSGKQFTTSRKTRGASQ